MEDLSWILALIQGHPLIAAGIAIYLLFFRGSANAKPSAGGGFLTFLVPILKYLLSIIEPAPPGPGPDPAPAPVFDLTEFLKRLLEEFLKARASGDKEHEEAVLKVMAKCEHCQQ
jgi:hypothetical protein